MRCPCADIQWHDFFISNQSYPMVWRTPQEATTVWKTQVLDGAADICDHSPGTVKVFLSNVNFGINTSRGYGRLRCFFLFVLSFLFMHRKHLNIYTKHNSGTCKSSMVGGIFRTTLVQSESESPHISASYIKRYWRHEPRSRCDKILGATWLSQSTPWQRHQLADKICVKWAVEGKGG